MFQPIVNVEIESVTQTKKGEIYLKILGKGINWKLKASDDIDSSMIELKKNGIAIVDCDIDVDADHFAWKDDNKNERSMNVVINSLIPKTFYSFTSDQKVISELSNILAKFPVLKARPSSNSGTSQTGK